MIKELPASKLNQKRYLSTKEASLYLGLSRTSFYVLAKLQTWDTYYPMGRGGRRPDPRYDKYELDEWMAAQKIPKLEAQQ